MILVHNTVPSETEYSLVVQQPNEMEHCAALVYPNHTKEDKLLIVGIYRPPEREHPSYEGALEKILHGVKLSYITTLVMGDYNKNAWEKEEKGVLQEWLRTENLWELADPRTPTHRAGTVTDGIILAPGRYMPEGILPQVDE